MAGHGQHLWNGPTVAAGAAFALTRGLRPLSTSRPGTPLAASVLLLIPQSFSTSAAHGSRSGSASGRGCNS
jgi:hypothetical protein